MKNNNQFIKNYTYLPKQSEIKKIVIYIAAFVDIWIYCGAHVYHDTAPNSFIPNYIKVLLIAAIFIFDIFALILLFFSKQMFKLIYLYTAIAFTGSSIFSFFISSLIFLHELDRMASYLIIEISFLIFILIIIAVILNIRNKVENGYKKPQVNRVLIGLISFLCITIGIVLLRQTKIRNTPFAIVSLVMAYALIPTGSGFHKFYLIIKSKH